jgi:hypothetical protein
LLYEHSSSCLRALPQQVLEDDFVRAGGVYMYDWDNPIDEDDF